MLQAVLKKNDKKAKIIILIFSAVVFSAIILLSRVKLNVNLGFDVHLFAKANAIINSFVAILLVIAEQASVKVPDPSFTRTICAVTLVAGLN